MSSEYEKPRENERVQNKQTNKKNILHLITFLISVLSRMENYISY